MVYEDCQQAGQRLADFLFCGAKMPNFVKPCHAGLFAAFEKMLITCWFAGRAMKTVCRIMTLKIAILAVEMRIHDKS